MDDGGITGAGVAVWLHSVSMLCKFTSFLGTSHWPSDNVDLGHFGIFSWRSFSFSNNGPIVHFLFLLCLFQKELKFYKDVSSSVVWFGL